MIRRDYILRLIEQFFEIVRRIVNYRAEQRFSEALTLVRQGYKSFLGADAEFVDRHSAAELLDMMSSGLMNAEQLMMAAKLLKEEAELLELLEVPEEARSRRLKSLSLFLEVFYGPGCDRLGMFFDDVEPLADALLERGLPAHLMRRLPEFYEQRGRFAKAEDTLFTYLEHQPEDREKLAEGVALFERLLDKTDAELEAGGLPRDETLEALDELRERV